MNGHIRMYDPATAEGWKGQIAMAIKQYLPESPVAGAVGIDLHFLMPRPKSHFGTGKNANVLKPNAPKWFKKKPDADNFKKAVMDAVTNVGFWVDDCLVCKWSGSKTYLPNVPGMRPGCEITITELE